MTKKQKIELIEHARIAQKNSYAPYSNFNVGAAVLTEDDEIYIGTNVENVSYGLSNCAERSAIFNAISHGKKKIKAIAITSNSDNLTPPCGACRQVIKEFSDKNTIVIMSKNDNTYIEKYIDDILPLSFDSLPNRL